MVVGKVVQLEKIPKKDKLRLLRIKAEGTELLKVRRRSRLSPKSQTPIEHVVDLVARSGCDPVSRTGRTRVLRRAWRRPRSASRRARRP